MAKKIEKAIILNTKKISYQKEINRFDIVYIGSFFCENLIPDITEIDNIFQSGVRRVAIQTSFFTQDNIENFKNKLAEIFYSFSNIELSINDLGLLDFLNKNYPKVKKGIGIPLSYDFMRMNSKSLNKFMNKNNLERIETDEDYLIKNFKERDFLISYHFPLKFIGVSRFCPFTRKILGKCSYECINDIKKLKIKDTDKEMILWQNAYFDKKEKIGSTDFNRLVIFSI
jgi:hypothetical protein